MAKQALSPARLGVASRRASRGLPNDRSPYPRGMHSAQANTRTATKPATTITNRGLLLPSPSLYTSLLASMPIPQPAQLGCPGATSRSVHFPQTTMSGSHNARCTGSGCSAVGLCGQVRAWRSSQRVTASIIPSRSHPGCSANPNCGSLSVILSASGEATTQQPL